MNLKSIPYSKQSIQSSVMFALLLGASVTQADSTKPIDSCGFIADEDDQVYVVTQDLTATQGQRCIQILGDTVVVDCQGHTLTGTDQTGIGILATQADNVDIQGCNVTNFRNGIRVEGSDSVDISRNFTFKNAGVGILVTRLRSAPSNISVLSNHASVIDNSSTRNGASGIQINGRLKAPSMGHHVEGNDANGNNNGIKFFGVADSIIVDNTANKNRFVGLEFDSGSERNVILDNTTNVNGAVGIFLSGGSDNNQIEGNVTNRNRFGIFYSGTAGNSYADNLCKNNQDAESAPLGLCD